MATINDGGGRVLVIGGGEITREVYRSSHIFPPNTCIFIIYLLYRMVAKDGSASSALTPGLIGLKFSLQVRFGGSFTPMPFVPKIANIYKAF